VTKSNDIVALGLRGLARALARGSISSVEATQGYLDRIALFDADLNSYLSVRPDVALALAKASDKRRAKGKALGPLDGIPLGIKDNIDVKEFATTAGIEALRESFWEKDAFVIERLRAGGAVFLGKLNMQEAAFGATNANEAYGNCINPWKPNFTPGGSSGGSGAASAAGLCAAALGTDTLGSVRIPAAYCGVAGFKPTYGHVSNRGLVALSFSLDHVGPLARSAADLVPLFAAMAGYDSDWPYARPAPMPFKPRKADVKGRVIGRVVGLENVDPEIAAASDQAVKLLKKAGARVKDVSLAGFDFARLRRRALLIVEAEASVELAEPLEKNPEGFSKALRALLAYGANLPGEKLARAYHELAKARILARNLFREVELLVLPTTPQTAFSHAAEIPVSQADFTGFANVVGTPAVSVPLGLSRGGLPMGLQFVGPEWADAEVLAAAVAYETIAGISLRPPGY
jgi:aspartyl-tRNA(Asn)/glutamyl-tRNA(Gln) amidotransferase subunit A